MQEKARQAISWPEAAAAARREILFLHHMATTHAASLDQLEAEGERRHLFQRARRTEFVANAREALGQQALPSPHDHVHTVWIIMPFWILTQSSQRSTMHTLPMCCGCSNSLRGTCLQPSYAKLRGHAWRQRMSSMRALLQILCKLRRRLFREEELLSCTHLKLCSQLQHHFERAL